MNEKYVLTAMKQGDYRHVYWRTKKQKGASKQNELKFLYTEPGNPDFTFGGMIIIDTKLNMKAD